MKRTGFTLIELLVVVGIIAILAAVAVPNFLTAQTRSKVARAEADMRTIKGALSAWQVDHNGYPPAAIGDVTLAEPLAVLTSPVAYLSSIPRDPFGIAPFDFAPSIQMYGYNYKDAATTSSGMPGETYAYIWQALPEAAYMLHSCGPNRVWDVTPYVEYDPTNGAVSGGDITRFGP